MKTFSRENPAMILTFCYVLITAIGIGYSFFFYREFDINIIKFADLSDFLLAAILEPLSLLMFLLIVVLILLMYCLDVLFRKRFKLYRKFAEKFLIAKYSDPIGIIVVIFVITVLLMQDLAIKNANSIKNEGKDNYHVKFSIDNFEDVENNFELLGSTSRFVYFYDRINEKSVVISPENINYMSKPVIQKVSAKEAVKIPSGLNKD